MENVQGQKSMRKNLVCTWKLTHTEVILLKKDAGEAKIIDYKILKQTFDAQNLIGYTSFLTFTKDNICYETEDGEKRPFTNAWKIVEGKIMVGNINADFVLKKNVLTMTSVMDILQIVSTYTKEE